MQVMTVPANLEARAADLIGAPFLIKGDAPSGWDCRGLARWCFREWCAVDLPDYRAIYRSEIVSRRGVHERSRLLAEGLAAWRAVEPQAGALALLEWLGRAGHVGFMLSPTRVLHADTPCGTAIFDLDDPRAPYRLKGAFVPAWIETIQHH